MENKTRDSRISHELCTYKTTGRQLQTVVAIIFSLNICRRFVPFKDVGVYPSPIILMENIELYIQI